MADSGRGSEARGASQVAITECALPCPFEHLFPAVARERLPFILDSSLTDQRLGRWSFLGFDPDLLVTADGRTTTIRGAGLRRCVPGSPFTALREVLDSRRARAADGAPPFCGGGVGYLAYDLKNHLERLPDTVRHDVSLPTLAFGFYAGILAYEHATSRCVLCVSAPAASVRGRADHLGRWRDRWRRLAEDAARQANADAPAAGLLSCNFTPAEYLEAVRRAIDYIAAGDIFQVNLSQRFSTDVTAAPFDLYRRLRRSNPAPFSAYLAYPAGAVLSSSPERFLLVKDGHVQTRPIKGTRPRTGNEATDRRMRDELLASVKDNAELTMIVDLERNDLGRVCDYGSVRVTEKRVLEAYEKVFHLVATVEGDLHPRHDIVDLLKATFPGGSITGAPKIRAMEIIDELEPTARSVYTGAIGYLGCDGACDLNVAIRTMLVVGGRAHVQVGGGIVADSRPEAEYQETLDKGRAMFTALGADAAGT